MKITEYGSIRSAADLRRKAKSGSATAASFADLLADAEGPAAPEAAGDVAATSAVSNMLALQEISEEEAQRRKLIQKGKTLLDSLEKLRHQLLIGAVPRHTLQELTRNLSIQRQQVSDPRLIGLIDDIELRAAVELAKLEMAAGHPAS